MNFSKSVLVMFVFAGVVSLMVGSVEKSFAQGNQTNATSAVKKLITSGSAALNATESGAKKTMAGNESSLSTNATAKKSTSPLEALKNLLFGNKSVNK